MISIFSSVTYHSLFLPLLSSYLLLWKELKNSFTLKYKVTGNFPGIPADKVSVRNEAIMEFSASALVGGTTAAGEKGFVLFLPAPTLGSWKKNVSGHRIMLLTMESRISLQGWGQYIVTWLENKARGNLQEIWLGLFNISHFCGEFPLAVYISKAFGYKILNSYLGPLIWTVIRENECGFKEL